MRILRNIAAGVAALILLAIVAVIIVVHTSWFHSFVVQKVVAAADSATGGRAEIGSIAFDWDRRQVTMQNFVIHGNEPAGAPPFVEVPRIVADLRLFANGQIVGVSSLTLDRPAANIAVAADGTSNVPAPPHSSSSGAPLQPIVDLAIGHFALNGGAIHYNSAVQPVDVQGTNLQVQLAFNSSKQDYEGRISFQPVYVIEGRNTPVAFGLNLPVTIGGNEVTFHDGTVTTQDSAIRLSGSVEDLRQPKISAQVNGHVAVADLDRLGNLSLPQEQRGLEDVELNANVVLTPNSITINGLQASLGGSSITASGPLKTESGRGGAIFDSTLNLDQLSKLFKSKEAKGVVNLGGKLDISGGNITVNPLRVRGFGGELNGQASLENSQFHVQAQLSGINLKDLQQRLGSTPLPYTGTVSGTLEAQGNIHYLSSANATAKLTVSSGRAGVPVNGHINLTYNGATGVIQTTPSELRLPHSTVAFSGSMQQGLHVTITSTDLRELFAAAPGLAQQPPVKLNNGQVRIQAVITGSLSNPVVKGNLTATRISVEDRQFDSIATNFSVRKSGLSLTDGVVTRGMMQARLTASVGLSNWSPKPNQPLSAMVDVMNGDLADILALAGQKTTGYSGALTASANINGTIGNPTGSANLRVLDGSLDGQPFDQMQAQVALADQRVTVPSAFIQIDSSRVDLTAEYTHARDNFQAGHLSAHVMGNISDLMQIRPLEARYAGTGGSLQLDVTVAGDSSVNAGNTQFQLANVGGSVAVRNLQFQGQTYGNLTANASTSGQTVAYTLNSNFAGSQIRANGQTTLRDDYATTLNASLSNLPVQSLLAVAQRPTVPAKGILAGNLHFSGTIRNPQGNADLTLSNAVLYGEPVDRISLRAAYLPQSIDVNQLQAVAGPSRLDLTAHFNHPVSNLQQGQLQFQMESNRLDLARIRDLQARTPGLGGTLEFSASGKADLRPPSAGNDLPSRLAVQDLNARIDATRLVARGKNLGDLQLTANTSAGRLNFALNSSLANASIQGRGDMQLSGGYPVNAQLTFKDLTTAGLQPLLGSSIPDQLEASTSGNVMVNGPVANPEQLGASVVLTNLQIGSKTGRTPAGRQLELRNQGDISVKLANGQVQIQNAHLSGPDTDFALTGSASIKNKTLALKANGNIDLAIVQSFNRDLFSSGKVTLTANVQGTFSKPLVNGRLDLESASISYPDLPVGIEKANGAIVFNGDSATIQNVTAQAGGGKVTLTGFIARANPIRFSVRANAQTVRLRVQQGVTIVVSTNLTLSGTSEASLASGSVTIDGLTYLPQTDLGSVLTRSAPPVQTASPSPILANMALDISVRTSSATTVRTSIAQNIQLTADLKIRGRAAQPGVLGSVQLNQGKLVFFGSTYTVSSGTISFYDPNRIAPILNVSLQTQAQGVTVVLTVTGPVDDMKLTYTSDPPLQFDEVVGLLAAGQTPTSDPTLLANQPAQPPQTLQQRGESAVVSKALAQPVANRLQRVFGVSQLKIDPSFTSGSELPQARVTLQQQVSPNLVFTYVTDLSNANAQEIRAQWSINPQWSAIANRDENGLVIVNLQYTKQFR